MDVLTERNEILMNEALHCTRVLTLWLCVLTAATVPIRVIPVVRVER